MHLKRSNLNNAIIFHIHIQYNDCVEKESFQIGHSAIEINQYKCL
jgi:hypothetical protein